MEENGDLIEFGCPSLLCEEQEDFDKSVNAQAGSSVAGEDEEEEEEALGERDDGDDKDEWEQRTRASGVSRKELTGGCQEQEKTAGALAGEMEEDDEEVDVDGENEMWACKDTPPAGEKLEQKQAWGRRQSEHMRNRKCITKEVTEKCEQDGAKRTPVPEPPARTSSEGGSASTGPPADVPSTCADQSISGYLSCGAGLYRPPSPVPLPCPTEPPPAPPQPLGTKRPHSPLLSHPLPQAATQPLEMEITQVCSTRRSIRYGPRGRGQAMPLMSGLDMEELVHANLLPPAPKKKTRTLYTTDQLEHLEGLFQEDHYPDADKRKDIAASVGVTPQRIMVWFQNRRAKWRKIERSATGKGGNKSAKPTLTAHLPLLSKGAGLPLPSMAPAYPMAPAQSLPTYSALLASLTSPGSCGTEEGGQVPPSSQGGPTKYHPPPMHSPPPLRRVSLPLFTTALNSTPPLLNTPIHTPPIFLEALEGPLDPSGREPQALQEPSSLFDYGDKLDYVTSSQQSNSLSYQLQTSYQAGHASQAVLPRLAYLTPSPYLTPNPPEANPTSYLTFGPGAGSTGVVTYAAGGHTYFQSQHAGQILVQSTAHHGGTTAYQSYPWGSMYSQPAMVQCSQLPPVYSGSLVASRDLQQPASALAPPSYFPHGTHGSSRPQCLPRACTGTLAALPPVSTLRPSCLRSESSQSSQARAAALVPTQVSPASPDIPPAPPCVKIEYDSPREIHSHFHCDFSPIHF